MAVADAKLPTRLYLIHRLRQKIAAGALFGLLAIFTLFTLDGGDIVPLIVSAGVLLLAAYVLVFTPTQRLRLPLPGICLLAMAAYGIAQTLWSSQKIVYDGWTGVLFWFTAGAIVFIACQAF